MVEQTPPTVPGRNPAPQPEDAIDPKVDFALPSPRLMLLIVALSIFAMEAVVMALLAYLPRQSNLVQAAIDSTLLILLLSPILYFFVSCPVARHLQRHRQAEEALRQSQETQLKDMLRASLDGYWMTDAQGRFLEVNDAYCRMSGYSRDELLNMGIGDVEAIEKPEDTAAHLKQLTELGSVNFETRHRRKDGALLDIEVSANFVRYDGARIHCFLRDISKRKEAEEALRLQSEITANSAEGISLVRASDGVITYTNRRFDAMFGYPPGALAGQHIAVINAPSEKSPEESAAQVMRALESGGIWQGEVLNKKKDGTEFWTSANVSGLQHPQHGLLLLGYHWDITARKQAEEDRQLAAMVYQNSREAIAVTDTNNLFISVNPAFEEMTGYTAAEVLGKNPNIMSSGRHDREFYREMWQHIISAGYWHGEVWDRRKNGEVYAKSLSINAIRNKDGSVHRYFALFSDITERKQSEELIWKQANFDALTELPNRRMFLDRLGVEVKKSDRSRVPLALLLIDLDHFKEVNDTLGHAVGDVLLQEAAFRIRSCVRTSDTVARLGGDEFTVVLAEITDPAHIEEITQNIIDKLSESFALGTEVAYISASVGITLYPNDAANIEDMMKHADQAMYEAKKNGRNRYSYYTHSLQESARKRVRLGNDLRSALAGNQLKLHFQPIVNLVTGRVHKAEALLRWQHPERGLISPADFVPLAEESGLIHEIGDWVFRESAHWAKRWSSQFANDFQVSVNKSPAQFRAEGNSYSSSWLAHLEELQLPGRHIVVEITEGLLLRAEAEVSSKLLSFRDAGMQIAIDDFGTGYSSLSYLKKFDIDYLKIDQTFVHNMATNSNDLALCEAIIAMAHKLYVQVIAEGVETEEQRALLARAGCDYAQGYLLSRPLPPDELELFLRQRQS